MPRLLLIDDDEQLGPPLAAYFKRFEFELVHATRPSAGLALLREGGFDAAILDVMLPEIDGPTALKSLQADERTRSIPVAFFTAKAMASEVERLRLAGARAVITKPFHPEGR